MIGLSILIPTVVGREAEFNRLYSKVKNQTDICFVLYGVLTEIIYEKDNKELTIGEKRDRLYKRASGMFSWQIDDDDDIDECAVKYILTNLTLTTDCLTFQEKCIINGKHFSSNHSLKYEDWAEGVDGYNYVRTPFMKSVIRTSLAQYVPVPKIRFGEDHEWARALKPYLKTEVHIDKELYIYQHNSKPEDHNTRYGITEANL